MTAIATHPRKERQKTPLFILLSTLVISGCTSSRSLPPPDGEVLTQPWGTVAVNYDDNSSDVVFSPESVARLEDKVARYRASGSPGKLTTNYLALSGGGSKGAYGAGILAGWSELGTRPEFDVVTGISTGALMATAAFLGSDWDGALEVYRQVNDEDIFTPYRSTAYITRSSVNDSTPLREMLKSAISDEMIEAVAERHQSGDRLFIGTTNLDADTFTIWDMGLIASSDQDNRFELYRDVVLASASLPVAFPPVYLPVVHSDGKVYEQMHVDGGVKETVFLFDYLAETKELAEKLGVNWEEEIDLQVYLLNNGKITREPTYKPVKPRVINIALASVTSLMRGNAAASLYASWTQALSEGATVHLTFIPRDFETGGTLGFDPETMESLYQLGYQAAMNGDAWINQEPPDSLEEFVEAIKIYDVLEPLIPQGDLQPATVNPEVSTR